MTTKLASKRQQGFGILELLVVLVITSIAVASVLALASRLVKSEAAAADLPKLQAFTESLVGLITDNNLWTTAQYPNNPSLACLSQPSGCAVYPQAMYDSAGNLVGGVESPLKIVDGSGAVVYDATVNPWQNGLTATGQRCGPNAGVYPYNTYVYPSPQCPVQLKVNWYPTAAKPGAIIQVSIRMIISGAVAPMGNVNTDRFSFDNPAQFKSIYRSPF